MPRLITHFGWYIGIHNSESRFCCQRSENDAKPHSIEHGNDDNDDSEALSSNIPSKVFTQQVSSWRNEPAGIDERAATPFRLKERNTNVTPSANRPTYAYHLYNFGERERGRERTDNHQGTQRDCRYRPTCGYSSFDVTHVYERSRNVFVASSANRPACAYHMQHSEEGTNN